MATLAQKKRSGKSGGHDNKTAQRQAEEKKDSPAQRKVMRSAYLQTKMAVSTPGDAQEQEADRVADEVSRMPKGVARAPDETAPPGSSQPENNAEQPQSLQTKISRMEEEPDTARTKLCRAEAENLNTKAARTEEEDVTAQTKLHRQEEGPTTTETDAEAASPETPVVADETEQKIESLRGQGNPMADDVRQEMEGKLHADFSRVSIHTSGDADALCKQLSARAFTVGNDIFFAAGEYAPTTEAGRKLLVHELTHVVQQSGGLHRKIMRDDIPSTGGSGSSASTVTVGTLQLPRFKATRHSDKYQSRIDQDLLYRPAAYSRSSSIRPAQSWDEEIDASSIASAIQSRIGTQEPGRVAPFIMVPKNDANPNFIRFGSVEQLAERQKRPNWNRSGNGTFYEADHIVELQVNGADDVESNYELLEQDSNQTSGRVIREGIIRTVNGFLRRTSDPEVQAIPEDKRNVDSLKAEYNIKFDAFRGSLSAGRGEYWTKDEIETNYHLNFSRYVSILDPLYPNRGAPFGRWPSGWNARDYVGGASENGGPSRLVIYANRMGGKSKRMDWPVDATPTQRMPFPENTSRRNSWIRGFIAETISFNPQTSNSEAIAGTIQGELFKNNDRLNFNGMRTEIDIYSVPGLPYVVHVDAPSVEAQINAIFSDRSKGVSGASPISVVQAGLDEEGVIVRGKLLPTIPLIRDADIDLLISGDDLSLEKTFASGELNLPSPFNLDNASLTLAISTDSGFLVTGALDFSIDNVGEGQIRASVASAGEDRGFTLAGEFNFDERLFGEGTTAQVRMGYANEQWSMGGTITIPEGKVPGVTSATIDVNYSEGDGFSARGDATLDIPGVESGTIEITQSEEAGFSIGGTFNLSPDAPGIRGGSISVTLSERPDGTGYALSATGEAQPDIPGINSNLIVSYNDGAFTAEIEADYSRGMLSGRVNAGVTNRSVGEDGQTLSETAEPDNPLIVYGGGSLSLQLAPWLQATAGVQFSPNGEITVTGEIGLPDELEIFARREINKSIFNIAVQAPIFPGIVAEIGGGLSATAGIGPGVIDQLRLGVTYNPDHEEDTHITGDAHLNIPANAGLRLSVRAGIGLGITGASATGGLDIGGTLGIEGAAEAGVHVDWTPATGLDIEAEVAVHAQPSFTFDIGGYVSVRALGFSVYDERWEFASYTFGSDYRFGIRLPIHYKEGEPFDISLDDVEFEVPDIDTNQLLRGLIARIA